MNVVTLAFLLFHAITWFNLAPQAMVVRIRGRPPRLD
jgi:fumarate reductase subunit C